VIRIADYQRLDGFWKLHDLADGVALPNAGQNTNEAQNAWTHPHPSFVLDNFRSNIFDTVRCAAEGISQVAGGHFSKGDRETRNGTIPEHAAFVVKR
jgi:hypothetical protein